MSINKIGLLIKSIRKEKGYTLKELSQKAGISISFLSDIENGRSNPSVERLMDIALALETPVSFFIENNEGFVTYDKDVLQQHSSKIKELQTKHLNNSNIKDTSENIDIILTNKDKKEIEKARSIINTFKKVGIDPEEIDLKELEILLKGYYLGKNNSK